MALITQQQPPLSGTIGTLNAAEEGIAPFVCKLYELVNDASTQHLISWSEEHNRQAFVVWDPVEFATAVLPKFFKHSNFCSCALSVHLLLRLQFRSPA